MADSIRQQVLAQLQAQLVEALVGLTYAVELSPGVVPDLTDRTPPAWAGVLPGDLMLLEEYVSTKHYRQPVTVVLAATDPSQLDELYRQALAAVLRGGQQLGGLAIDCREVGLVTDLELDEGPAAVLGLALEIDFATAMTDPSVAA